MRINPLEIGDSITAGEIEIDSDANLLLEPDAIVVRVVEIREEEDEEEEELLSAVRVCASIGPGKS